MLHCNMVGNWTGLVFEYLAPPPARCARHLLPACASGEERREAHRRRMGWGEGPAIFGVGFRFPLLFEQHLNSPAVTPDGRQAALLLVDEETG